MVVKRYEPRSPQEYWDGFDLKKSLPLLIVLALVLIVAVGGVSSAYTVAPEGMAVVKRFGKVVAVKEPGLHFKLPFGIDSQTFVPTERILKEEFGFRTAAVQHGGAAYQKQRNHTQESLMLTGDLKVIDVEWVVQYQINDPDRFLHRVQDPIQTIRDTSEAVMRRIVGNSLGSDVLTQKRVQVATGARDEIQTILNQFDLGVRVVTVELQDVTPPDRVKPAFNEVNQAEQERERMINEAEKRRSQAIPRAQGEALRMIDEAQGYSAQRVNRAKGEADRFASILAEYQKAPEVTRQRMFLEMIDDVLPKMGKIYVMERGQMPPVPLLNLTGHETPAKGGR